MPVPGTTSGDMDSFPQQGAVDWVSLSTSVVSTSLQVAQRISAAGVSPLTFQAGLALSTRFRLSELGYRRVEDALINMRIFPGFEKLLWFGFGHKSFIALLTETQAGFNCAALCGALAETYGCDRAAQLLQALWKVYGLAAKFEPSRSQFRALVEGCSGLLAATPFPEILRRMAGPCVDSRYLPVPPVESQSRDIAMALDMLFQVSKGTLRAVQICGGSDLAFLGAVAYWLFDLRIWVELPNGETTFRNSLSHELAQVQLLYANVNEINNSLLSISGTTLLLRSIEDLITDDPYSPKKFRIEWKSCLAELFCADVESFLDQSVSLGKALGAIARIYEALYSNEVDVAWLSRTHFINFQERGHGAGFLDNLALVFPEFDAEPAFRRAATRGLSFDVPESIKTLEKAIEDLENSCECGNCGSGGQYFSCNVVIVIFLRTVSDIMAHVDLKASISPTQAGLKALYSECRAKYRVRDKKQLGSFLEIFLGLPHVEASGKSRDFGQWKPLLDGLLRGVVRIFTGSAHQQEFDPRPRHSDQPHCTALVDNGICIWSDALQSLSIDPASLSTIHVTSGQILYNERNYRSVWDLSHTSKELLRPLIQANFITVPEQEKYRPSNDCNHATRALATEKADSREITFVYEIVDRSFGRYLQPGILTEEVLAASARVPCPRNESCSDQIQISCLQRTSGWNFEGYANTHRLPIAHKSPRVLWNVSDPISRLMAVEGCRIFAWSMLDQVATSMIVIRSGQCMACISRYLTMPERHTSWEHCCYIGQRTYKLDTTSKCIVHII